MILVPVIDQNGKKHPSIRACARAHSVNRLTVAYHLDQHGDLSRLGLGQSRPGTQNAAKPIRIGQHEYPSRVRAAEALGISVSQLNRWTSPKASPAMQDMLLAAVMQADRRAA